MILTNNNKISTYNGKILSHYKFFMSISVPSNNYTLPAFTVRGVVGNSVNMIWGDGTITTINFTGSDQSITKNYTTSGTYNVFIDGDLSKFQRIVSWNFNCNFNNSILWDGLLFISVSGLNTISGDISNFKSGLTSITINGLNTLSGNIGNFKSGLTYIQIQGDNTITGDIINFKSGLTYIQIAGNNTLLGDIINFKSGLNTISILGNNTISGNISNFKSGLISVQMIGNNTLSGDIINFKSGLTYVQMLGKNTLSGDIATFKTGLRYIQIQGQNTINQYSGKSWESETLRYFRITQVAGQGLNANEVAQLVIDLSAATWITEKVLYLASPNAAPTPSEALTAALATLAIKGVIVTLTP